MKALLLTDGIYPFELGGMQKHSFNLIRYYSVKVEHLTIVHCTLTNDVLSEEQVMEKLFPENKPKNISIIYLSFPKFFRFPGHYIYSSYLYSKSIYKKLNLDHFDLIYAQGFTAWHILKKVKNRPPLLLNFHGYNMFDPFTTDSYQKRMLKWAVKTNLKKIQSKDRVISLGGKVTEIISTLVPSDQILVEPNGIEKKWLIEEPEKNISSPRKFLFVGRNDKVKRIDLINQVISEAMQSGELTFQFDFVGDIPETLSTAHENIKVVYHKTVKDEQELKRIYDQSDVLVLVSDTEGMPTVINEAMARGCVIIATNVGAVAEQVDDSNGWLIKRDSYKELKKVIEKVIHMSENQLTEMKHNSSLKVKKLFLWEKVIENTLSNFKN